MLVDWFTVAAQIANFLILVLLLRVVLFRPIRRVMAERERRIAAEVAAAREQEARARREGDEYAERRRELDAARESSLAGARHDAQATRDRLTAEARADVEALKRQWLDQLDADRERLLDDLARRAGREAIAIARAALHDLTGAELGERLVDVFIQRVGEALDRDESLRDTVRATAGEPRGLRVRTPFALSDAARTRLEAALEARLDRAVRITCDTDDELTLGIELRAGGRAVSLGLDGYLADVARRFAALVDRELEGTRAAAGERRS